MLLADTLAGAIGAAAAFIGFSQMIVGAMPAAVIGLWLPGTIASMVGAMGVLGSAAVGTVLWTELGQPGKQPKVAQLP